MNSWEQGVEIGRLLEKQRGQEGAEIRLVRRVTRLEQRQSVTDRKLDTLLTWIKRAGVLIVLWGSAIGLNLTQDELADRIAIIIKATITGL